MSYGFPKLRSSVKETKFDDVEHVKRHRTENRTNIPKEDFQKCFEAWKKGLDEIVTAKGDCFEGDKLEFPNSSLA